MPTICTLAKISTVPSRLLSAEGAPRTLSWEIVCPSAGTTTGVAVGGSSVGEGRGVCVGGRVAVMMTTGDGVGVSGTVTSALQPVLKKSARIKKENKRACEEFRFTVLLYPRI